MHTTAYSNSRRFKDTYCSDLSGKIVVEIGSQDVNGSIRTVFDGCERYIGLDFCMAKGVDILLSDPYLLPLEDDFADIIVCSSVFEHSEFFWLLFNEVMRALKPAGLFYLNAPSNGLFHRYPVDCWRFYPDAGNALARWGRRSGYSVALLESYVSKQEIQCWNDFIAIFIKDEKQKDRYKNRILDSCYSFSNGLKNSSEDFLNLQDLTEDLQKIKDLSNEAEESKAKKVRLDIVKKMSVSKSSTDFLLGAFIDSPNSKTNIKLVDQKLLVRGWALPKAPFEFLNLAIRENGLLRCYPLNETRPDVIRNFLAEDPAGHNSLNCGFKYEFLSEGVVEIGIESDANFVWLSTVRITFDQDV